MGEEHMIFGMIRVMMLTILVPPPSSPPELPAGVDAVCLAPKPETGSVSAQELAQQAADAARAEELGRAEALAKQAIGAFGSDVARAWALRILIDMHPATDTMKEVERILACGDLRGEAWTHARAWLAYRQGRYSDSVDLLEPLARPRHHTIPRWSIVHEDLGDAYAQLGRRADAQAQWRIALATNYDPGHTGWSRTELESKLAADLASSMGSEPMLPLQRYSDAMTLLDVASVEGTEAGVKYAKLVLLQQDKNGVAFGIDAYEVDCDEPRSRVISVKSFDASGRLVRQQDATSWGRDLPGEPWLSTERSLVCSIDPALRLTSDRINNVERLELYRAGELAEVRQDATM